MPDLLVPLYKLPARSEGEGSVAGSSVLVRRANSFEQTRVRRFIEEQFSVSWADEVSVTFARLPVTSFIAVDAGRVVGFAAYEATRRNFFGPTGVAKAYRGRGIGKALLIASLWGLCDLGYAYGIIGAAGPTEFYRRAVNAVVIADSVPGIYTDMLRDE
jgi:GNAT superfamily N-acetyltransferase